MWKYKVCEIYLPPVSNFAINADDLCSASHAIMSYKVRLIVSLLTYFQQGHHHVPQYLIHHKMKCHEERNPSQGEPTAKYSSGLKNNTHIRVSPIRYETP